MKDRSVAEKLENLAVPKPRAEARLAARNAALVEFARVQAQGDLRDQPASVLPDAAPAVRQGFWSRLRLSRDDSRHGSSRMKWGLVSRTAFGAAASGCVAAFALAMMWPMFRGDADLPSALPSENESTVDLRHPAEKQPLPAQTQTQTQTPAQRAQVPPQLARAPITGPLLQPIPAPDVTVDEPVLSNVVPAQDPNYSRPMAAAPVESYRNSSGNVIVVNGERRNVVRLQSSPLAVAEVDDESGLVLDGSADQRLAGAAGNGRLVKANANAPEMMRGAKIAALVQASPPPFEAAGDDKFQHFENNPIKRVIGADAVSTFSVDVDTASYSFARRMINEGRLPQKDAVRVEEMINYFDYAWPKPESRKTPFAATIAVSDSPWTKGKKLVHIGIKGYDIDRNEVPDANLVFLMDVSGSMDSPDKLPLAVQSMKLLLQRLKPTDTVAIVVYAGAAGTVLEPTAVKDEGKILKALDSLQAGGSTAGAEGIELAYQLAEQSFRKGGVNRVMLTTDGDFNVGIDNTEELKSFIERKREKGIFLSVLGFGEGNYRDELAQALAQNGNGVAAYIDTIAEAKKVLVEQSTGSLFTIAKDVKLQVEFNPRTVAEYRLVGYETRALKREDFNNDKIDAGDVGAGHTVTALYEITPVGSPAVSVDPMRYQPEDDFDKGIVSGSRNEYGFLKIRYKLPNEDTSTLVTQPIPLETRGLAAVIQREVNFSTAVAGFAQLLRGGAYTGKLSYEDVIEQAQNARGEDRNGYRAEFVNLVRKAQKAKGM
jgi:Ca-activated chloride channel family protein